MTGEQEFCGGELGTGGCQGARPPMGGLFLKLFFRLFVMLDSSVMAF